MLSSSRDVSPFLLPLNTTTEAINPSALHPFPTLWPSSFEELGQGEVFYPLQNGTHVLHGVIREVGEAGNVNTALSFLPEPFNDARPGSQEQRLPSGKGFPFKLYSMLEDETINCYVGWSKIKGRHAFSIPDIEAFVTNVLPKHFNEMKQWGSFQKQLNNYGFNRQGRGPDNVLYVHSGDKFRQGRPDLLPDVRRRPPGQTPARSGQKRPSTPLTPTADSSTVESGSQKDPPLCNNKYEYDDEWLRMEVLELKRKLKSSEERLQAAESRIEVTENQLQITKNQLQITERRCLEMQNQLFELSGTLERAPIGDGASNSVVDPGPAQLVDNVDVALNTPAVADGGPSTYHTGFLEDVSFQSYFSTGMICGSADLPPSSAFLAL